jgi:hypothetical protein
MVKLLIALCVVVVLVIGLDAGARAYAEHRVAGQLQSALRLSTTPSASIAGWPFTVDLVRGRFPSVTLSSAHLSAGELEFSNVKLKVRDVRFSASELLAGTQTSVHTGGGRGSAVLSADAIDRALQIHGIPLTVKLANGKAAVTSSQLGASVTVAISVQPESLSFGSVPGLGQIAVPLPPLGAGIEFTAVRVADSKLVLTLRLAPGPLQI